MMFIGARTDKAEVTAVSFRPLIPGGTCFRPALISDGGISSNRSSIVFAPMLASIAEISSSVWGINGMV
jgi:hypothetical protein